MRLISYWLGAWSVVHVRDVVAGRRLKYFRRIEFVGGSIFHRAGYHAHDGIGLLMKTASAVELKARSGRIDQDIVAAADEVIPLVGYISSSGAGIACREIAHKVLAAFIHGAGLGHGDGSRK